MQWLILFVTLFLAAGCKPAGQIDAQEIPSPPHGVDGPPIEPDDNDDSMECEPGTHTSVDNDPRKFFSNNIYSILRDYCTSCHVDGGAAGYTAFSITENENEDYEQTYSLMKREVSGYPYLLMKATGFIGHTGGALFSFDSSESELLRMFATLINDPSNNSESDCERGDGEDPAGEPEINGLFDGVVLLESVETLRKASMIMLGRWPTSTETESVVVDTSDAALRRTLREMMRGEEFDRFLMRGANDKILTDSFKSGVPLIHPDYETSYYRFAAIDWPGMMELPDSTEDDKYNDALAEEPLRLIEYIVNNERDYREVLTANYTVFNSLTHQFFDSNNSGFVEFIDPDTGAHTRPPTTPHEWVAGRFIQGVGTGYYTDAQKSPHPSRLQYPHSGALTTQPWLARWQNTATNGQRKRAKMLLKQFLGYDIERTGSRPLSADALKETGNPTFENPACTGCHSQLDPLAGAFQNWGYLGRFRLNATSLNPSATFLRTDALNGGYRQDSREHCGKPIGEGGYCEGDLWYADRFAIGVRLGGVNMDMPDDGPGRYGPYDNATVQWAAERLVATEEFAVGTVEFWFESIFNQKPLAPAVSPDTAELRAYVAQQQFIAEVAEVFASDNGNGRYNLKDMLVELFVSPWFRAEALEEPTAENPAELDLAGMGALLTPEQLEAKVASTLGVLWGGREGGGGEGLLTTTYNVLYGGIDSDSITERNRRINPLMINVIRKMASDLSCEIVYKEFIKDRDDNTLLHEDPMLLRPSNERLIFAGYAGQTPLNTEDIKKILINLHHQLWDDGIDVNSDELRRTYELFKKFWVFETEESQEDMRCNSNPYKTVAPRVSGVQQPILSAASMRVWRDMLVYFMLDPQFLHE